MTCYYFQLTRFRTSFENYEYPEKKSDKFLSTSNPQNSSNKTEPARSQRNEHWKHEKCNFCNFVFMLRIFCRLIRNSFCPVFHIFCFFVLSFLDWVRKTKNVKSRIKSVLVGENNWKRTAIDSVRYKLLFDIREAGWTTKLAILIISSFHTS